MRSLLRVENFSESELYFEDLDALRYSLAEEIALGNEAVEGSYLLERYTQAYTKIYKSERALHSLFYEYSSKRNFW